MIPTRDIGTRYNGLATVPTFGLHVPPSDEGKGDLRKMLNEVKHLYFDRRYRQCASKCLELLDKNCSDHHPLVRTFLYFYAALSYDSLARSMHNHSVARVPSLQQSEEFYNKALATLPEPLPIQQDENRPQSPPKLSLSLPAQDDQPKGRQPVPSMWDLTSTFDAFDLSSSASRRHSFNSSKHSRTDSLVTDVSWAEDIHSDPFTDDKRDHKPENNYLSVEPPSIKRPSPLQVRKARSSDSLLSEKSAHTDSPAQTPSRNNKKNNNGLDTAFQFPPPETPPPQTPPPQTHGFVDMVEGTPIQWATTPRSSQQQRQRQLSDYDDTDDDEDHDAAAAANRNNTHGNDADPTTPTPARVAARTPLERTHPCPCLLFPRDLSSTSLLPLPLAARIQHYNGDLSAFRAQLVSHLLAIQLLKAGGSHSPASSRSVSGSSTSTSTATAASPSNSAWSEATATNSGGAVEENRRRSGVFAPALSLSTDATTATHGGGDGGDAAAASSPTVSNSRGMTPGQKEDRIREGRKRMWARERFDPSGCRELARLALQECEA
ncbi:uncharacterized protein BKCO1_800004 [Diplodia corticola]|uniref:Uncharacterized protein n=1 Tax=Diplodia corticola TaxID=236234 RepID=A0A1J9RNH2_9PEZI|nr:uncharacterized protein BKCO1_800004 [Diplodia corticola]OJD29476.1 hypothetical protein BKCO1_800004 [Diplodia corticola]